MGCNRENMMKLYDAEGNVPLHSAVHAGDIKVCNFFIFKSIV